MSFFPCGSRLRTISLRSFTRAAVRTHPVTSQLSVVPFWSGRTSMAGNGLVRLPPPTWKSTEPVVKPGSRECLTESTTELTVESDGMSPKSREKKYGATTSHELPSLVLTKSSLPSCRSVLPFFSSHPSVGKILVGGSSAEVDRSPVRYGARRAGRNALLDSKAPISQAAPQARITPRWSAAG